MKLAIITNEHTVKTIEPDSDGWFWDTEQRGNITYTCCGYVAQHAATYMMDGDGDKCPNCESEIEYKRQAKTRGD